MFCTWRLYLNGFVGNSGRFWMCFEWFYTYICTCIWNFSYFLILRSKHFRRVFCRFKDFSLSRLTKFGASAKESFLVTPPNFRARVNRKRYRNVCYADFYLLRCQQQMCTSSFNSNIWLKKLTFVRTSFDLTAIKEKKVAWKKTIPPSLPLKNLVGRCAFVYVSKSFTLF